LSSVSIEEFLLGTCWMEDGMADWIAWIVMDGWIGCWIVFVYAYTHTHTTRTCTNAFCVFWLSTRARTHTHAHACSYLEYFTLRLFCSVAGVTGDACSIVLPSPSVVSAPQTIVCHHAFACSQLHDYCVGNAMELKEEPGLHSPSNSLILRVVVVLLRKHHFVIF
jgi:hypothetical protein